MDHSIGTTEPLMFILRQHSMQDFVMNGVLCRKYYLEVSSKNFNHMEALITVELEGLFRGTITGEQAWCHAKDKADEWLSTKWFLLGEAHGY